VRGGGFEAIGEGEEGVACDDAASEGKDGFGGAELDTINTAHLAGAGGDQLAGAGIDDGVGLDVFDDAPSEFKSVPLFCCGGEGGGDAGLGADEGFAVGTLDEVAAGDRFDDGLIEAAGGDGEQAEVLLGGEQGEGLGAVGGGGDGFDEGLGDFGGGIGIEFAVEGEHTAEGADGVGGEGLAVAVGEGGGGGAAARVGVLDDGAGGEVEFGDELPGGIEIDKVVVAEFLALELGGIGDAVGASGVEGGGLVGVFAVAQGHLFCDVDDEAGGHGDGGGDLLEGAGDGGVVGGGGGKGGLGEAPVSGGAEGAAGGEFVEQDGVIGGIGDDGDILVVLGGGADHGGPADVDVFDQLFEVDAGLGGGFLEGVEIDDDHVDAGDAVLGKGGHVGGVGAHGQDAGGDAGVDGFDAAVEHFGKAGEVADFENGEAGFAQGLGGTAGGNEFDAECGETFGEINEAGLVGDAQQSAFDFWHSLSVSVRLEAWLIGLR